MYILETSEKQSQHTIEDLEKTLPSNSANKENSK